MKTRLITAGFGLIFCFTVFWLCELNSIVLLAVISVINMIIAYEYISARKLEKNPLIVIPCLLFALLIPLLSYTEYRYIPIFLLCLSLFIIAVLAHEKVDIFDVLFVFAGVMLISLSMAWFAITSCKDNKYTSFWCVLIVGIPWIADSVAYFVGSAIGKHKLCPKISPKKSVEGAAAGIIGGTLVPLLFGLVYQLIYVDVQFTYWLLLVLGFVNSIISIFGDLVFSLIKRRCGIKDYGTIMPGHGGLLDRFDSVIFCIPVIYIVSQFDFVSIIAPV